MGIAHLMMNPNLSEDALKDLCKQSVASGLSLLGLDEESKQKKAEQDATRLREFADEEDRWREMWREGKTQEVSFLRQLRERKEHDRQMSELEVQSIMLPLVWMMFF